MHLNDGQLRTYLDGELAEANGQPVRDHLAGCSTCRTRLDQLTVRTDRIGDRLASIAPRPDDPRLAARSALAKFRTQTATRLRKENESMSVKKNFFSAFLLRRWRPALTGLIALILAVGLLTFPPARQTFSAFLSLFRIKQITILEVDSTRLSNLTGDAPLGKRIGELMSDTVTVTKESDEPQVVDSVEEASQQAGFPVRLFKESPSGAPPRLTVQDNGAFHFNVDRARAQAILDETGYEHLKLPEEVDGARVEVEIPVAVSAAYGDCPTDLGDEDDGETPPPEEYQDCLILAQTPGPTVNAPPELDLAALAEVGLQILGMNPEEARDFSQAVDWTSTLVVPIPRNGTRYKQVDVDGVTGNLIYRRPDENVPERYTILWIKNDLVYALAGFGDPNDGVQLANALQ